MEEKPKQRKTGVAWNSQGKRKQDRPRITWKHQYRKLSKLYGKS